MKILKYISDFFIEHTYLVSKTLIFFMSLVVASSVYSADEFFEKKPSMLILKDEETLYENKGREHVDFFELSKQIEIVRTNRLFKDAARSSNRIFQTANMSEHDKYQYSMENKSSYYKGYSPHIESTQNSQNRRVISEEEYQQQMSNKNKMQIEEISSPLYIMVPP